MTQYGDLKPAQIIRNPRLLLAFGFGAGLSPYAPGTMGTLVALVLLLFLPALSWPVYLFILLLLTLIAIYLAGYAEQQIKVTDHSGIVCDEMVGFWLTTFLLPPGVFWLLLVFGLFRIFDITKPWPINVAQRRCKGGFGIVLDDLLAGIYSWAILQTIYAFYPHWLYHIRAMM
jgi:phosphatidylglycerophosphatase A